MPACARLRHVAGARWGDKRHMNLKRLEAVLMTPPLPDNAILSQIAALFANS